MANIPTRARKLSRHLVGLSMAVFLLITASSIRATDRPLLITIDDLPIAGGLHSDAATRRQLTGELLAVLAKHRISAVGMVTWGSMHGPEDREILRRWLAAGHELGNHSFGHLSYSRTEAATYIADIEKGRKSLASFLLAEGETLRFFRFPFLREGDTLDKLQAMRDYLQDSGQRNLPVTLDNQDWSFEKPWVEAMRAGDAAAMRRVAESYHEAIHLSIRHQQRLGDSLFERPVPQILLLHANAVGAAQWDRLFTWLRQQGYRFAGADEVLADPALSEEHAYLGPRGPGYWDRLRNERRVERAQAEIQTLITEQVAAWNRGDLETFCAYYAEAAIFVSPTGLTRGRAEVLARYRRRYPTRAAQGQLSIEILELATPTGNEISLLGDARPGRVHGASVVGRWHLTYPDDATKDSASGMTLIILQRQAKGWRIVRDASM
jgi:peptidoglycan/xylan/chitin deacetylase (PgdA/CDA1 family)